MRIATVSFLVRDEPHTVEDNLASVARYTDLAAARGADIVCFPEDVLGANVPGAPATRAQRHPGPMLDALGGIAASRSVYLVAPFLARVGRRVYGQAVLFDRDGEIAGVYRKVQPNGAELRYMTPADKLPVFDIDCGRVAVMLCFDLYFPEIARIYALKGADVLFWPTVTHGPTQEALLAQLRARAIDNSLCVVEANLAGMPPYAPYRGRVHPGNARIVDHHGDVLASTGRRHGVAVADIDPAERRLTADTVLLRDPDRTREDLESLLRMDIYAAEYARLAARKGRRKRGA
jgi:predicted amidohydrolase